jgi:hypothetical protein
MHAYSAALLLACKTTVRKVLLRILSWNLGSQGDVYEDDCLLECCAMQTRRNWPTLLGAYGLHH